MKTGVTGDIGSLVVCEPYESERRRSGVRGDEAVLSPELFECDRTMPGGAYSGLRNTLLLSWSDADSSLRRETCLPEESLACMLGREAMLEQPETEPLLGARARVEFVE